MTLFNQLAELCEELSGTSSRLLMVDRVAEFLGALSPKEAEIAARFLAGHAVSRGKSAALKVSARAVWQVALELSGESEVDESLFADAADFGEAVEMLFRMRRPRVEPTLTLADVEAGFEEIAAIEGRAARQRKLEVLRKLLAQATEREAKLIAKIVVGEMRHGMGEGLLLEAIAKLARQPLETVQRVFLVVGEIGQLAAKAREGTLEIHAAAPKVVRFFQPLRPMLAQSAATIEEAFASLNRPLALEHKLDGARVQIHCVNNEVRIFSRRLNDVTASLPDLVERVRASLGGLAEQGVILDGEVIALDTLGRPRAFQDLMRRFRRAHEIERLSREMPLALYVFDILAWRGELTVDLTYQSRWEILAELAEKSGLQLVARIVPSSVAEGETFFEKALALGYEGVMAKALDSHYLPGTRGGEWLKIKRAQTLDLVIVAADWGYGRRRGWLSNYHLAARSATSPSGFEQVGKTFKGPTDQEFAELTERLLSLKLDQQGKTVIVRPELVVEVGYSDIQRSPRYSSGYALRFARILRVRDDKTPDQADSIETVAKRFEEQVLKPKPL